MTPDEYRAKYKNCNTCVYYNDFGLCKVKRENIPSSEKAAKKCKVYKPIPYTKEEYEKEKENEN